MVYFQIFRQQIKAELFCQSIISASSVKTSDIVGHEILKEENLTEHKEKVRVLKQTAILKTV